MPKSSPPPAGIDGANPVVPVIRLVGLAVDEGNLGAHGVGAVDHRDIKALDAVGMLFETQVRLQVGEHLLARFFLIMPFGKALAGVLDAISTSWRLSPRCGVKIADLLALALAEILFAHFAVV